MAEQAMSDNEATLVELLQRQAIRYGDKTAFLFSYNGDGENASRLTYRGLDTRAKAVAAHLQQQGAAGQRVLVFCRPGLSGIIGYFGCLYAGAIAVPVHERLAPRLSSVVPDACAGFAIAPGGMSAEVRGAVNTLVGLIGDQPMRWCATDVPLADAERWTPPQLDPDTTAMVQYTSGSTTAPNGVVLTHANLVANLAAIHEVWPGHDDEVAVYWLPSHHDMGLIGAVLEMIRLGCTTVLMSPSAFIQRPMRWLEAISDNRGTFSTAPNFAYELCVQRSTPAERAALDLSHWAVAMNGAEPVRGETMRAFAEAFAPAGFRPEAFCPVYGLAEATLLVSGGSASALPRVAHLDRAALEGDRIVDAAADSPTAVALVSCGVPRGGQRVVIVDPETRRQRGDDEVGEIWVAGPNVAQGYLGQPEKSAETFAAFVDGTGEGPFLRTGDLGFLRDGELFVAGRYKDLVILDGANHYPNDIEATVRSCHPALSSGNAAAFAVTPESGTAAQLVLVHEVVSGPIGDGDLREIVDAVEAALDEHHRIRAGSVILTPPRAIPTTSSGKVQRGLCRQHYLDRGLDTVAEWHAPAGATAGTGSGDATLDAILSEAARLRQRR